MRIEEYASAGIDTDAVAANSAGQRPTTMRAMPYAGKTVAVMTTVLMYLIVSYARCTSWISQAGAIRYVQSEWKPYGTPRRAGWPVSAIERASCVSSSSSEKTHGVACAHASTA